MGQSSLQAAHIVQAHGASACTDITGFGLLGHLVEMARASGVEVALDLHALPVLAGALECLQAGIYSSLQTANTRQSSAIAHFSACSAQPNHKPRLDLLFDPQTAGGLLCSVPAHRAQACVGALREAGYAHTSVVGQVRAPGTGQALVWLVEQ